MAPPPDKGVTFAVSGRANKKYTATLPDGKQVHFGDKRYGHYKDQTPLKAYRHLDHGDPARRKNFFQRHGPASDAKKHTPRYFASRYLW